MVAKKPLIKVRFFPPKPDKNLGRILPIFKRKWLDQMRDFEKKALMEVKEKVPVRTGATRRSVKSTSKFLLRTMTGQVDISGNANFKRLDRGTRRSPGRYIPFIGRRIITSRADKGFHPGIRGLNIIQEARNNIENEAKSKIRSLKRDFKFSVRTAFK